MNIAHIWKLVLRVNTTWKILFLCSLNLLFMHYNFFYADCIENEFNITTIIDNILGIAIDVTFLFLFLYVVIRKHIKIGLTIIFGATLFWSFSNVLYSRFFHHYISLSAIGQGGTLFDPEILRCIVNGFRWTDLYYIICACIFFLLVKNVQPVSRIITKVLFLLLIVVGIDICSYLIYCSITPEYRHIGFFIQRVRHRQLSDHLHLCDPNNAVFRRGCIRTLLYESYLDFQGTTKLSDEQRKQISNEIEKAQSRISKIKDVNSNNIIFILVESYMSFTSDMTVNGREVTPFLNSLKRDTTVYFNGKMHENVTIGESSDGQFIYMTGLLPLRSLITVSKARSITLKGLPKVLGRESQMVIPTVTSMWDQDEMCRQYGFNYLYASNDFEEGYHRNLNDEQVFQLAMQKDKDLKQPFFSVILTFSMHQPYTKLIDSTFPITDLSMPQDLICYLNACHYTDKQIEAYFNHLKRTGLYDNSMIVIVSDHSVHNTDFGGVRKDIPLYIVNRPMKYQNKIWEGECNQIDVYTTMLDLLGVNCDWYGLGQSLLSPNYHFIIDSKKWDVSEWIIRGDYFNMN